jgi:hypothetical protein
MMASSLDDSLDNSSTRNKAGGLLSFRFQLLQKSPPFTSVPLHLLQNSAVFAARDEIFI